MAGLGYLGRAAALLDPHLTVRGMIGEATMRTGKGVSRNLSENVERCSQQQQMRKGACPRLGGAELAWVWEADSPARSRRQSRVTLRTL